MQRRDFLALAADVGVAAPLRAEGIAGAWESETETPQGYIRTLYQFDVDGSSLSGSIFNDRTGTAQITNGTINDDAIEFIVEMGRGPRTFTVLFKGTVSGDEMELTREFQMPEGGMGGGRPGGGGGQGRPGGGTGGRGGRQTGPGGGRGGRGGGMGRGPQEVYATRVDEQGMLAWEAVMKEFAANPPQRGGMGRGRGRRGGGQPQ